MTKYDSYTKEDFQAMSSREFEAYVQSEYNSYMDSITHLDDRIEYGEYFHELEFICGRKKKQSW